MLIKITQDKARWGAGTSSSFFRQQLVDPSAVVIVKGSPELERNGRGREGLLQRLEIPAQELNAPDKLGREKGRQDGKDSRKKPWLINDSNSPNSHREDIPNA